MKEPLTIGFEFNPRAGDKIPNIVDKSKISVSTRETYQVLKIMAKEGYEKCRIYFEFSLYAAIELKNKFSSRNRKGINELHWNQSI